MRPDLSYAQASLDWAISNLPSLEERLNFWLQNNIKTVLEKTEGDATHDVIIAVEKTPFPLSFSVEVGSIINAVRSSLDILAFAVHKRNPVCKDGQVYFPIAESKADWERGTGFKGSEFIAGLGSSERGIFETLKPYNGGNATLYWLHRLDIIRKHKRLMDLAHAPKKLTFIGDFRQDEFVPLKHPDGYIPGRDGETVLGLWAKTAAKPKISYAPEVLVEELELGIYGPVMPLLGEFTRQAQTIIKLFDA
jgi:hypothetical protein